MTELETINKLVNLIKHKKMEEIDRFDLCKTLFEYLYQYYDSNKETDKEIETQLEATRIAIIDLLPILTKLTQSSSPTLIPKYYDLYMQCYAFSARTSLEHFINYMEWDRKEKVLPTRISVLKPFIFYLNKSMFDKKLRYVRASYAPSMGKSFTCTMYSAWALGRNMNGSILRVSFDDSLVLGFSRAVQDLIINPRFSEVFPNFRLLGNKPFEVEKMSDWKIKNSNAIVSHYAKTRDGGTTGVRVKTAMIFDDLIKGRDEIYNDDLHNRYYEKWKLEWFNRYDTADCKFIFVGTMWSPKDLLNRIMLDVERYSRLIPSKQFKYVLESEDGEAVFINVPLLDENMKSTCEYVTPTKEALKLKDTLDPFEFSCVYQQNPIALAGREFSYEQLMHFSELPEQTSDYSFAVLDPARKGKDYVSMPIFKRVDDRYYLTDVVFQQKAMTELYDIIIDKLIEHNVIKFVIENNTDTSLRTLLEERLKARGIITCEFIEKYNVAKKEIRIRDHRGNIKRLIVFKDRTLYPLVSDYGKFVEQLNTYSFEVSNKHDDAPDSLAMFVSEIALGRGSLNRVQGLDRQVLGI